MTDEADTVGLRSMGDDEEFPGSEHTTFAEWRATRPFYGALALVAGGFVIAWPSLQFVRDSQLLYDSAVVSFGVIVGALIALVGLVVLVRPAYATSLGLAAIVLSAVSFVVAFGGLLVGMVLSSAGGVACFAWEPAAEEALDDPAEKT